MSRSATLRMSLKATFGALSRSAARRSLNSSRSLSGMRSKSTVLSTWPIFIAAPFICPSCLTSWSARSSARRSFAAVALSSDRTLFATFVAVHFTPWPPTSEPNRAVRARRLLGTLVVFSSSGMRGAGTAGTPGVRARARGRYHGTARRIRCRRPCPPRCSPSTRRRSSTARSSRCPKSIKGADGRPVNALLGTANLLLQAVDAHAPARGRPVLRRRGRRVPRRGLPRLPRRPPADAARARAPVGGRPRRSSPRSAGRRSRRRPTGLEADDLLGALARVETAAGGTTLLFTGDRDMFQCVGRPRARCCSRRRAART